MIVAVLVLDCRKEFVDVWVEVDCEVLGLLPQEFVSVDWQVLVEDSLFFVEVFACDLLDYEVSLDLVIVLSEDLFSYFLDLEIFLL